MGSQLLVIKIDLAMPLNHREASPGSRRSGNKGKAFLTGFATQTLGRTLNLGGLELRNRVLLGRNFLIGQLRVGLTFLGRALR